MSPLSCECHCVYFLFVFTHEDAHGGNVFFLPSAFHSFLHLSLREAMKALAPVALCVILQSQLPVKEKECGSYWIFEADTNIDA